MEVPRGTRENSEEIKMNTLQEVMNEYKKQLEKGSIQKAYRGLMEYMLGLRTHFQKDHPDHSMPGNLYYGYMDMTYFSIFPRTLKERDLKIAIVFLHKEFRFEVWLSGKNRRVMTKTWKLFSDGGWEKCKIVSPGKGVDSILEHIAVPDPDFDDPDRLTAKIEEAADEFIRDIESFLSSQKDIP